jgi:hypothetical protein
MIVGIFLETLPAGGWKALPAIAYLLACLPALDCLPARRLSVCAPVFNWVGVVMLWGSRMDG